MGSHSTDDKEFSVRLSSVLDYSCVNDYVIQFRRKMYLAFESELTLIHKAFGRDRRIYMFGSQIKGTTTTGMMSDADFLQRFDTFRLFLDSEKEPLILYNHLIVIKVSTHGCASQYCVLTMIEASTQAKNLQIIDPYRNPVDIVDFCLSDRVKADKMIPNTIMFDTLNPMPEIEDQLKRHGPAKVFMNTKQCKFFFERPRPGHWPSEKTLKKAKKYGIFIVPQGPPKSTNICSFDYFENQWRISTNLTERLLMFSLDTVHLQAYVLTKMIRKELFMPNYQNRLSTFHFKTAFFFAVENTRSDMWREDNVINCVKYILSTLKRFLNRRYCPHFTIDNVNLFDGKIEIHEFPKLVEKLTHVVKSLRTLIENISMDNIGTSLNGCNTRINERISYHRNTSLLSYYVFRNFHGAMHTGGFDFTGLSVEGRIAVFEQEFTHLEIYDRVPLKN
ncbi:hypothetical protein DPMN_179010 [Dreissena polymorpha]|uniref:Mab-21-like HhH/H2TH-like domain-containing protein n=1 Tax=Dreissena polymorpha TaxID=45954 RepID=A0A9D4ED90_DREPO|nr:hypothetical protein DPMN_179010 [Dreissena polymorpha]